MCEGIRKLTSVIENTLKMLLFQPEQFVLLFFVTLKGLKLENVYTQASITYIYFSLNVKIPDNFFLISHKLDFNENLKF